MKNVIIVFLLLIGGECFSQEIDAEVLYKDAYELLERGAYNEAIGKYEQLETKGLSSSNMQYNQGTAYLRMGDVAHAVLYLERAFRSDPGNADIRQNLALARDMVDSDIVEIPDFVLLRAWRSISGTFSPLIWLLIEFLFAAAMLVGLYRWKFLAEANSRLKGFIMSGVSLVLLCIAILAGYTSDAMVHQRDIGILMKSTDLRIGADERSDSMNALSEGVKVKIKDQIGEWYKVQLINKEEGWLKVNDVEIL